ncbi:MAG TPA: spore germination protein, partial [Firmicutes bacterium]|nr:spore germination protein [Bacillota bacterium]
MKNSSFYQIAVDYLTLALKVGENFDAVKKEITYKNKKGTLFLLTTLTSATEVIAISESLINCRMGKKPDYQLYNGSVSEEKDLKNLAKLVFSGVAILLLPENEYALTIEVRNYPTKGISEPNAEKSVRGSKDGFTESINDNIGLLRRRVRDKNLKIELITLGSKSKSDVALVYLDGVGDKKTIDKIREKLNNIDINSLVMTSRALVEKILPQRYNPFPLARYTERPDIASINLFQGKILLICDTSPDVIILPITIFDHFQDVEEYHQSPLVGSLTKIIRTLGIFLSVFLVPLWYILITETGINNYFILRPSKEVQMPLFLQIIIAELFVELIRLAIVHAPSELTSSIGVVAAIILGSVTIELDLFLPEVLVYVSFAAIASFATPSYELSLANRLIKVLLLTLCFLFGRLGFILGCIALFVFLVSKSVYGISYLYPLIPFDRREALKIFYRDDASHKKTL